MRLRFYEVLQFSAPWNRDQILQLFVGLNFLFLAVDVAVAHSVNQFYPRYEWLPVLSAPPAGFLALWIAAHPRAPLRVRFIYLLLLLLNAVVGVLGLGFHAYAVLTPEGEFSWSWLVFGAPVLAPLSFTGVALIGLFALMEGEETLRLPGLLEIRLPGTRTQWLYLWVALGFLGAGLTSYIDHARFGFVAPEWIPVVTGLLVGWYILFWLPEVPHGRAMLLFWLLMGSVFVGVLGFGFHLVKDLSAGGAVSLERLRSLAPIMAPLLFSDLGILGVLVGLQTESQSTALPAASAPSPGGTRA